MGGVVLKGERAEGSLFNNRVIKSQLFSLLNPSLLSDYEEREVLLRDLPFARLLLEKGLSSSVLVSMLKCGSYTGQAFKSSCFCGDIILPVRHKCSSRVCPVCSKRRKRRLVRKYVSLLRNLVSNQLYSLKLFTISPQNYSSFEEGSKHIRASISKMLRRKFFKDRILGGLYVLETKTLSKGGERNGWNCHVHLLVYSRFMNNRLYGYCQSCKRRVWVKKEEGSDSFYCSNRSCNRLVEWDGEDSILTKQVISSFGGLSVTTDVKRVSSSVGSLSYCLKYISSNKDDFATDEDFADYIVSTSGRRLVTTFGCFWGYSKYASYSYTPFCCPVCFQRVSFELVQGFSSVGYDPPDI